MAVFFHQCEQVLFELLEREGVPHHVLIVDFDKFQRADVASLDPWGAVCFEKHRVGVLEQQSLQRNGELGVVTVGCHQRTVVTAGL